MTLRYRRPGSVGAPLPCRPLLESWNANDHPDQIHLAGYLQQVADVAHTLVARDATALVLELTVGLGDGEPLTSGGHDLDNYAFPLMRKLDARRFDAVFVTKQHAPTSSLAICPSTPASGQPAGVHVRVRTTTSSQSRAWKEQIHNACGDSAATPLGPGPVSLDIAFRGSRARNWSALWKPAIDALGALVGVADERHPFRPDDDRIVDLALHWQADDNLADDVILDVWADLANDRGRPEMT